MTRTRALLLSLCAAAASLTSGLLQAAEGPAAAAEMCRPENGTTGILMVIDSYQTFDSDGDPVLVVLTRDRVIFHLSSELRQKRGPVTVQLSSSGEQIDLLFAKPGQIFGRDTDSGERVQVIDATREPEGLD